ncbi:MAG TPA: acyl-CoA dehydrogenase [Gammaproteobacteria bacterium]|nr:acyl-CoA dehydrogenase [Gammaproteobacteria bacterium]
MDFNDSPQEAKIREEVRAFLSQHAEEKDINAEEEGMMSMFEEEGSDEQFSQIVTAAREWQQTKADAGWACVTWPKQYGGRGGSILENIIFSQEEAKFKVPNTSVFMLGIGLAGPTIQVHGTEAQREKFLPRILRGEDIWCQLFSEPAAGSDLAGLRTSAVKDGDEWVVNGQKVWNSGAHYSNWGILVTRTDPTVPKHKGMTYFLVDMNSPGIEVRPIKQITGGANFNEVFMTDVRIPDANRLDQVGNGWAVALTTLMNERMGIGGGFGMFGGVGLVRNLVKILETYHVNGQLAIYDSASRQRIASYYSRLKALELTGNRLMSGLAKGGVPGVEGSTLKLSIGLLMQEMAAFCMEIQGPMGALVDENAFAHGTFQQLYLGIPAIRIAGGTDEIQRNIIGERMLGLPSEQRVDKGIPFNEIPTSARVA